MLNSVESCLTVYWAAWGSKWNDAYCGDSFRFVCQINDVVLVDECADSALNDCDPNATCTDTAVSYECTCNDGFFGDGTTCQGIFRVRI